MHPLKTLEATGFRVHEGAYCASTFISAEALRWALICVTIEGGYEVDWGHILVHSFSIALDSKYRVMIHFNDGLEIHAVRPQLDREVDLLDCRQTESSS